jgi:serine/threonine protein phosphatase PrpC
VKEEEMKEIGKRPLRQAAEEFVKRALERGAPDNVTVIVARVVRSDKVGEDTLVDQAHSDHALLDETVKDREITARLTR